jgi:hypothetical protein
MLVEDRHDLLKTLLRFGNVLKLAENPVVILDQRCVVHLGRRFP